MFAESPSCIILLALIMYFVEVDMQNCQDARMLVDI